MENKIIIREALRDDMAAVLALIKELATYERAPDEVTVKLEELERDGFGDRPLFSIILAEIDGKVIGMSFYYNTYSTWKGKCVYIEDIVVKDEYRRKGIGAMLFEEMIRIAQQENAHRLHWQVLDWNEPAISFYRKYEAILDNTWINGKLTRENIQKYFDHEKGRSS